MRTIDNIVIHCTATSQQTTVEAIQRYWREQLGWKNPGYHVLIEATGKAHELQPIEKPSNGARGFNANSIHISYVGGIDAHGKSIDNRTMAQKLQLASYIRAFRQRSPDAEVLGHCDLPNVQKDCPCFDVREWVKGGMQA